MKFLSDLDLNKLCRLKNALLDNATSAPATYFSIADNSANDNSSGLICHYDGNVWFFSKTLAGSNNGVWKRLFRSDESSTYSTANRVVVTNGSNQPIASPDWGVSSNNLDMGAGGTNRRIVNLADPINDYDAVNKRYVDSVAVGLRDFKDSVVFASTAATGGTFSAVPAQATITGASISSFDNPGVTVTVGMRVLVKDQAAIDKEQNGIYEITAINAYTYDLRRTLDANVTGELSDGTIVFVEKGPTWDKSTWVITDSGTTPVLNTDDINWVLFSQVAGIVPGAGLTMTGSTIDVNPDNVLVQIVSDQVTLKGPTGGTNYKVLINTTGGAAAVPTWGQVNLDTSIAQYVTGVTQVANGGTGRNTLNANYLLLGNGTSQVNFVAPSANSVLWSNAGTPSFTSQPTLGTGIITKGQVAVRIDPYNTAAGNTGELQLLELAANGVHYVGFKAPDSIATNKVWVLPAADGSANHFMKTDGAGNLAFAQVTASMIGSGAALTKVDDTNVTLTLGGTPTTALLAATSITVGWSGLLSVARGGTGISTVTQYAVAVGGATTHGWTNVGTAGQILIAQSAANPAFTSVTGDVTITAGGVTAVGANKITNAMFRQSVALSVVGNATNATANVADIAAGSDFQILRRSGTAIAFGSIDLSQSGAVGTSLLGVANGGTGVGTLATNGVLYGNGTGVVQVTTQGGANTVLVANAGAPSFSGQPTLATGIITKGQNAVQIDPFNTVTGNTGELRFKELAANGSEYVGFKAPDAITTSKIWVLPAADGSANHFLKTDGTGNLAFAQVTAAMVGSGAALTKVDDTNVTLTLGGTPASALLTAASITVGWTGTLAVGRGGTGTNSVTQYAVAIGGSGGYAFTNVGTSGQLLIGQGASSNPVFTTVSGDITINGSGVTAVNSAASLTFKKLTLTYGTASGSSDPVFSATQTWNNAATTFTGVSWTFTTTASQSASLLFNLLAGSSPASVFSIRQDGYTSISSGLTVPLIRITSGTSNGIIDVTNGGPLLTFTGVASAVNYLTVVNAVSGSPLQLNVGTSSANNANLQFYPSLTGSTPSAWGAVVWKDNAASSSVLRMTRAWSMDLTTGQVDRANTSITVGALTSFTISHEFGTANIQVIFNDISTGAMVMTDWVRTPGQETRQITVSFKTAPASGAYRLTVIG